MSGKDTMMTEKLYYTTPKQFEWKTAVTEKVERDGIKLVKLKETAFYPDGGGQPADEGTINDVSIRGLLEENEDVYHIVSEFPQTNEVTCKLNISRRIDHMQHHSGQHLLSAVCIELFDFHTESFHLGSDTVTIDLSTSQLSEEQMKQIEEKANQYIFENRNIHTFFAEQHELKDLPLRKLPDVTENIRIVQITGIDTSACCGTHVERTGEIGILKLLKTEKQKSRIRLHFICGFRALADYQISQDTVQTASQFFQTSRIDIPSRLQTLDQETKHLMKENEQLKAENAAFIAEKIGNEQQAQFVHSLFEKKSIKELQMIAARLLESGKTYVLLASLDERCVFLLQKGTLHCGSLFKEHLSFYQGKGGGNEKQAQAKFDDSAEAERFFLHLIEKIKELNS